MGNETDEIVEKARKEYETTGAIATDTYIALNNCGYGAETFLEEVED